MCQKFWLSGLVHSLFCQYYCILFKALSCQLLALLPVILMQYGARFKALDALTFDFSATTAQGSLFRSNPTDGSDLIVSPRARMPVSKLLSLLAPRNSTFYAIFHQIEALPALFLALLPILLFVSAPGLVSKHLSLQSCSRAGFPELCNCHPDPPLPT